MTIHLECCGTEVQLERHEGFLPDDYTGACIVCGKTWVLNDMTEPVNPERLPPVLTQVNVELVKRDTAATREFLERWMKQFPVKGMRLTMTVSGVRKYTDIVSALCARLETVHARGYLKALQEYAWWKDGVQYVGSCGKTFAQAYEDYRKNEGGVNEQEI